MRAIVYGQKRMNEGMTSITMAARMVMVMVMVVVMVVTLAAVIVIPGRRIMPTAVSVNI